MNYSISEYSEIKYGFVILKCKFLNIVKLNMAVTL